MGCFTCMCGILFLLLNLPSFVLGRPCVDIRNLTIGKQVRVDAVSLSTALKYNTMGTVHMRTVSMVYFAFAHQRRLALACWSSFS